MPGPSMSDCATIDPLVTPYVDDQLSDTARELVERHVQACPPCHARVTAERAVHDLIRARRVGLNQTCAPRALHSRCAQQMRGQTQASSGDQVSRPAVIAFPDIASRAPQIQSLQPPARSFRSRLAPLAFAASLVLIVGAAFLYRLTVSSTHVMAAELAADHLKCSVLNGILHTHDDPSAVESSMLTGFGWKMRLPEAPNAGLELVGSRPCIYGEGKIAHIMYRRSGEPVSLFMLPETGRAAEMVQVLGHRAAIWCDGKRTFVLVTKQPQQEVERLASMMQASLK